MQQVSLPGCAGWWVCRIDGLCARASNSPRTASNHLPAKFAVQRMSVFCVEFFLSTCSDSSSSKTARMEGLGAPH